MNPSGGHMFGFQKISKHHRLLDLLPGLNPPGRADERSIHTFEPRNIVMAMRFHIVDCGLARAVDGESCGIVESRLAERAVRICIAHSRWHGMADFGRLFWLMKQSWITMAIGLDGIAVLLDKD